MEKFDLINIDFYSEADLEVFRVANDELSCMNDYSGVFFFGQLVNDVPFVDELINENKYYAYCPVCGKLIKQNKKPVDGSDYQCPHCSSTGRLYDFRDPQSVVNDHMVWFYGFMELLDNGYALRLFNVTLDFSGRDYSDYTTLDYFPDLVVEEVGREYWYEGRVEYYARKLGKCEFEKVSDIDDSEYYIVNYDNPYDPMSSPLVSDIVLDGSFAKTFIEAISKRISFRTFHALRKYGFNSLLYSLVYCPYFFGNSKKISEVLGLDYNQVVSCMDANDVDVEDILAIRELNKYGLSISEKNIEIMSVLSKKQPVVFSFDNAKKTFKYLRNQMSRAKHADVARDYFDYISECIKLGLNVESSDIRYPTDLSKAHQRTSSLIKIEKNRAMDERIQQVYERCHFLCEFSDGTFCIVMPSCSDQIIQEGKQQSHCVGGYCERMANGEDIILFLRKVAEPDKPFYTMEIRPSMKKLELVQCRGYKNSAKSDLVDDFLTRYEAWFNKRNCDESDGMVRKYYKVVCKCPDGRYISFWDNKTEYKIGEVIEAHMEDDPDRVAVQGIHIASLEFAKRYGATRANSAILEIEVDMRDVVVPNAKDQLRTRRGKVLRELIF